MAIIGCSIMMAGLIAGALFVDIPTALIVMAIGLAVTGGATVQEHHKERQAQAWRKNYPSYRY